MVNQSQAEKLLLERAAAKLFAHCFEYQFNQKIHFISNNPPQKPDVTCMLDGKLVDFEIAHLYGSQAEAQQILGKSLTDKTREELLLLEQEDNTDERLIKALNRILVNKASKQYDSDNVWLVIRNANPHWSKQRVLSNLTKIHIPISHPFKKIWLIADFEGKTGLVELFS